MYTDRETKHVLWFSFAQFLGELREMQPSQCLATESSWNAFV